MAMQKPTAKAVAADSSSSMKYVIVGAMILVAFFASYRIAQANSAQSTNNLNAGAGLATTAVNGGAGGSSAGAAGAGGGCCGGAPPASGVTGAETPGAAQLDGSVQKIYVDLSQGSYSPNVLKLKAGVPAEITFGQGSGCLGSVQSSDLGFQANLSSGPQTVKIASPKKGTYAFTCGMSMVYGKIVVE